MSEKIFRTYMGFSSPPAAAAAITAVDGLDGDEDPIFTGLSVLACTGEGTHYLIAQIEKCDGSPRIGFNGYNWTSRISAFKYTGI